ncbi:hypothetical protein Ancab_031475, partial [Ancistrocladus abbreviatus]
LISSMKDDPRKEDVRMPMPDDDQEDKTGKALQSRRGREVSIHGKLHEFSRHSWKMKRREGFRKSDERGKGSSW